jgi:UDP-4-amino-4-deoxy-L-arabinose-oxoglutarate aminotransferase
VFVNDCSPDDSLSILKAIAAGDANVIVVDLARNYGQHKAMMTEGCIHAHHVFPVFIQGLPRDAAIAELGRRGVEAVVNYRPVHLTTYFRERFGHRQGDFPVAERLGEEVLSLPFYPDMPTEDVDAVVAILRDVLS